MLSRNTANRGNGTIAQRPNGAQILSGRSVKSSIEMALRSTFQTEGSLRRRRHRGRAAELICPRSDAGIYGDIIPGHIGQT